MNTQPAHQPDPNRYIRYDVGKAVYIVKERFKDLYMMEYAAVFNPMVPSNVIEACIKELNKS